MIPVSYGATFVFLHSFTPHDGHWHLSCLGKKPGGATLMQEQMPLWDEGLSKMPTPGIKNFHVCFHEHTFKYPG